MTLFKGNKGLLDKERFKEIIPLKLGLKARKNVVRKGKS